ncbi:four-carbon acid sugar kinase family protein [Thalassococcus sp. CAU 1522]|uniref:3-oxo-tetronate kinase n=1 Tax=Thalassococcus arenae TaxID=2851652 RepID=A0ABS6N9G5_9RHOB|nr:3-oxo-tetronate kinase [Thalassococcus arenae]MBV2360634.1 four-carbon acid sugar kinase family protein [Thalassococcus arenae]
MMLGIIADDYTGATDIAVTLVNEGMRVVQVLGVPEDAGVVAGADAVVVALKSRTIAPADAVSQSLAACDWLRGLGARQIFFKYCSTFDSTAQGNIGPVADALGDALGVGMAFVCPAFPVNKRSVYMGHLFVGDRLLSESPMKDHPLTPMRDSDLVRLMSAQSAHDVGLIALPVVMEGPQAIADAARALVAEGRRYAVVDAVCEADLRAIGRAAADMALVTGGSGVAKGLPANFGIHAPAEGTAHWPDVTGGAAVLAGSCSAATRGQIARVRDSWPVLKLDVDRIAAGADVVAEALAFAAATDAIPLIYASSDPDEVAAMQAKYGRDRAGAMVEDTIAEIANGLVAAGRTRLVVAGGETSGAVLNGLGVRALRICSEIDPGVPWCQALDAPVALALKSGNFGSPDFFVKAFEVLP